MTTTTTTTPQQATNAHRISEQENENPSNNGENYKSNNKNSS